MFWTGKKKCTKITMYTYVTTLSSLHIVKYLFSCVLHVLFIMHTYQREIPDATSHILTSESICERTCCFNRKQSRKRVKKLLVG